MKIQLSDAQKKMCCEYIDMLASVINDTKAVEPTDSFNWNYFCKIAQRNSVLNILACYIEKIKNKPDEVVLKVAQNDKFVSIIKETSQLVEVEKVLEEFEKEKIKNIPLKGYFMKELYPQSFLRSMNDIDIYVDISDFKKVVKVFEKLQYNQKHLLIPTEIQFINDNAYFEIQGKLEEESSYFSNPFELSTLREGYEYSYKFNNEDFYLYMIYHCASHFKTGGLGIRMIMDIYIYLNNHKNLDVNYLERGLEKLGLSEFEKHFRKLAMNWFSNEKTEITPLGEFILYCSTYGEMSVFFYQDSAKTQGNFWLKQIFIPYSRMKKLYPYLEKKSFLLPIAWFQYWFTRIFIDRNINVKKGIENRQNNISNEDKAFLDNLMNELNI